VKVKVLEIDIARKRIALTMRLQDSNSKTPSKTVTTSKKSNHNKRKQTAPTKNNALANKLSAALKR